MAKGWKLEPGRHALAAKGVPTGRKSYVSSSITNDKYREDSEQGRIARQARHESIADVVKKVATDEQRETLASFESGDEYQFFMLLNNMQKAPFDPDLITPKMIDKTLEIMVNSVEGDTTQMPHGLVKYAAKKGWLMNFLTEVEIKEALGEIKPQGLAGELATERQEWKEAIKARDEGGEYAPGTIGRHLYPPDKYKMQGGSHAFGFTEGFKTRDSYCCGM